MENSISGITDDAHPLDVAARIVGGRDALGRLLGVSAAAIGNWKSRGVPFEQCMPIERATLGVVTRRMLRADDWQIHWPELAGTQTGTAIAAIEVVADAQAAIKHVEAVAVAEIKHVADELLKDGEPWDGVSERRTAEQPWDGVTERRKLNAPLDRRVSPESVARAAFLRSQPESSAAGKVA
jgi:DNA-binding transcriptional regulator YdaS (Cro superfamily)